MANKLVVDGTQPLEIEFLDKRFDQRAKLVLSIDADPADSTGATARVTIGAVGITTNVLGTLENNGDPVGGSVDGQAIAPSSVTIAPPPAFSVRVVAGTLAGTDLPSNTPGGPAGVGHTLTQNGAPDDIDPDVDPMVFEESGNTEQYLVRLATAAPLPACVAAGAGVGKTLTAAANGVLTVDGGDVVLNDEVLVKDEEAPVNNGVYLCTTEGTVGVKFVLTRSAAWDEESELGTDGSPTTDVAEGDENSGTTWGITPFHVTYPGPLEVDNVLDLVAGDVVLVANATSTNNRRNSGIYTLTQQGDADQPWILTRSTGFDQNAEIALGALVTVTEGDHADEQYLLPPDEAFSVGSSTFDFVIYSGATTELTGTGSTLIGPVSIIGTPRIESAAGVTVASTGGPVTIQENPSDPIAEHGAAGAVQMTFIDTVDGDAKAIAFSEALRLYLIARGTMAAS